MKKYIAAGGVAVVAFAFAASAASLNVDGGVLQSGIDRDLTCSEDAVITYDHHTSYGDSHFNDAWITGVWVELDEDCVDEGNIMIVTLEGALDEDERHTGLGMAVSDIADGTTYLPTVDTSIADIEGVSVTISNPVPGNGGHVAPFWRSGAFDVS